MPEWLATPLLVFAGIVITGIVSWLTTKLTSSTQKKTAEIEASGPSWKSFTEEIRKQNEETKSELNGKIDRLQTKVSNLEDGMRSLSSRYHKALVRLGAWHRRYPDDPLTGSIPEELVRDMQYNYLSWQYPSDDGDAT